MLLCLTTLLASLACSSSGNEATPSPALTPSPTPATPQLGPEIEAEAIIASCVFFLEVADTPDERAQGLMGRESLLWNRGMLFVFGGERVLSFWMRNTLIPLDIVFLDQELEVVDVQTMQPERENESASLPVYTSAAPAMYAIEINEGAAERCGIESEEPVVLRFINPKAS